MGEVVDSLVQLFDTLQYYCTIKSLLRIPIIVKPSLLVYVVGPMSIAAQIWIRTTLQQLM